MPTYNITASGTYDLPGTFGNDVTVDTGLTVVLELTSTAVNTFSISSNVDSVVTIDSTSASSDVINLETNGGTIVLGSGLVNTLTTAQATIDGGGTYLIDGNLISHLNGGTISFQGDGGTNIIGTAASFTSLSAASVYSGFEGPTDTIDDRSLSFSKFSSYSIGVPNSSGDQSISIFDTAGGGNYTFTVFGSNLVAGSYSSTDGGPLKLANDGRDGALITTGTPCYCRGTLIRTDQGEVAVEDLQIGDQLITMAGEASPLRWIGRRSYGGRFIVGNRDVLPVMIKQGALCDNVPQRNLFVSPLHAMFLDGMLIPALALVNDISIVQAETVDSVEYFHLELEVHDVIYAEGALSETFVDDDSRGMFHNAEEHWLLYPETVQKPARYCAPRVEEGLELEVVRQRIAARTRPPLDEKALTSVGRFRGHLDVVQRDRLEGWAHDEASSGAPVLLRVLDNGVTISQVLADTYRNDLERVGIADGKRSFSVVVPGGLSPERRHVIQVQRMSDGGDLHGSPFVLEAVVEPLRPTG